MRACSAPPAAPARSRPRASAPSAPRSLRAGAVRGRGRGATRQHVPLGGGDAVIHHSATSSRTCPRPSERFTRDFGAGPFHAMEHIAFDEVTFDGEPAVYDHSSAFGAVGADHRRAHAGPRRATGRPGRDASRSPARARPRRLARRRPGGRDRAARGARACASSTPAAPARVRVWFDGGDRSATPSRCCSASRSSRVLRDAAMTDVTVIGFGLAGASRRDRRPRLGRAGDRARADALRRRQRAQLGRLPVRRRRPACGRPPRSAVLRQDPARRAGGVRRRAPRDPRVAGVAGRRRANGRLPAVVAELPGRGDLPPVRRRPRRPRAVRLLRERSSAAASRSATSTRVTELPGRHRHPRRRRLRVRRGAARHVPAAAARPPSAIPATPATRSGSRSRPARRCGI